MWQLKSTVVESNQLLLAPRDQILTRVQFASLQQQLAVRIDSPSARIVEETLEDP